MVKVIGERYKIKRELPGGNMSTVFLCVDMDNDLDESDFVAVKLFNKTVRDEESELQDKISVNCNMKLNT